MVFRIQVALAIFSALLSVAFSISTVVAFTVFRLVINVMADANLGHIYVRFLLALIVGVSIGGHTECSKSMDSQVLQFRHFYVPCVV
ncbi:hypothetical protein C8R48DRAFT_706062 [Suillus tomentosus]|nr:hypothetical protein C8R48DRAFT_706062 [Suillus tomentosus]